MLKAIAETKVLEQGLTYIHAINKMACGHGDMVTYGDYEDPTFTFRDGKPFRIDDNSGDAGWDCTCGCKNTPAWKLLKSRELL